MNQNVLNNSNWLKKLNSENLVNERNSLKPTGSDKTFSNFFSNQLSRVDVMQPKNQKSNVNVDNYEPKESAKTILKKIEPTASKLSVKSPEKASEQPVKELSDNNAKAELAPVDKATDTEPTKEITKTETKDTVKVDVIEDEAVSEESGVKIEDVLAMIEQALATLINQLTDNADVSKTENLQAQIEALSSVLNQIGNMQNFKIDEKTADKLQGAMEQILMAADEGKALKPEVLEMLKSAIKEIKEKANKVETTDFSKVLAGKTETQSQTTSVAQTTTNEASESDEVAQSTPKSSFGNITDEKNVKDSSGKPVLNGKEKLDVQVQTSTDNKNATGVVNTDFNAKLESSSIAFSKAEMANQANKVPVQQSIMDQLINSPRMQIKQTEQGTMMTMKLNPEVLGDVEIKMEIIKGVLQAEIKVENMIVKGAIEANLSDLKNALSDKGYQVESLNVSVGKENQDGQGQRNQQQADQNQRFYFEDSEHESGQYGFEAIVQDNQIDYKG